MNIFYYLINIILAILCILFGIICLTLPWNIDIRANVIALINDNSTVLLMTGIGFLLIGFGILFYIFLNSRKRSYCLKHGRCSIMIDDRVFSGYIKEYLSNLFPSQESSFQMILRKKNILLSLDVPFIPKIEQESITERIFEDIIQILSEKMGYSENLKLTIFFQPPPVEGF